MITTCAGGAVEFFLKAWSGWTKGLLGPRLFERVRAYEDLCGACMSVCMPALGFVVIQVLGWFEAGYGGGLRQFWASGL